MLALFFLELHHSQVEPLRWARCWLFFLRIAPLSGRTAPVGLDAGSHFLGIAPLSGRTAPVGLDAGKNEQEHETVALFDIL